jgi:hypothetical protein
MAVRLAASIIFMQGTYKKPGIRLGAAGFSAWAFQKNPKFYAQGRPICDFIWFMPAPDGRAAQ